MPEGPECHIYADLIHNEFTGLTMTDMSFTSGRYVKHSPPKDFHKFLDFLPMRLIDADCHGKMIFMKFKVTNLKHNQKYVWVVSNLGLSGKWSNKPFVEDPENWKFNFKNKKGSKEKILYYSDIQSMGILRFMFDEDEFTKLLHSLGPDPIIQDIALSDFIAMLRRRTIESIVETLLNQKKISGIGNYMRSEILYHAKIDPRIKTNELGNSEKTAKRLLKTINKKMRQSYNLFGPPKYGGTFVLNVYQRKTTDSGEKVNSYSGKNNRTVYHTFDANPDDSD